MSPESLESLVDRIIRDKCPSEDEWGLARAKVESIIETIYSLLRTRYGVGRDDVVLLGSVARGTYVKDEFDADVFILFRDDVDPREVVDYLEEVLEKALDRDVEIRRRYADHPYLEVIVDDGESFKYNIVPAFRTSYPDWKSPVDRSYYHNEFLISRGILKYRCDAVALKYILRRLGVYGSEAKTGGFSGYLTELLVLYYGGVINTIRQMARWVPPVVIDWLGVYRDREEVVKVFGERSPLIFVDPVDRGRNVASALTWKRFSLAVSGAKHLIRDPSILDRRLEDVFDPEPLVGDVNALVLHFTHGERVEDIHYPQMYRLGRKLANVLRMHGFDIYRVGLESDYVSDTLIVLILESVEVSSLSLSKGPIPYRHDDTGFLRGNVRNIVWMGEDGRWYSLKPRRYTSAERVVSDVLGNKEVRVPGDVELTNIYVLPRDLGAIRAAPKLYRMYIDILKGDVEWRFLV